MQNYLYDPIMDGTYCVVGYNGDEEEITVQLQGFNHSNPVSLIFDRVFKGHTEIRNINLPDTLTELGEFVFDGCTNLKEIHLPDGFQNAWPNAFARCGLEKITFPDKVASLAPYLFRDCKSLKIVECGKGLKKINNCAFFGCTALEKIIVPQNTEILPKAFEGCGREIEIVRF